MKMYRTTLVLLFLSIFSFSYAQIDPAEVISSTSIGPSIMSGRVVDLDVNPDDPTEFYVAYASGGLWHTVNNGTTFTPVMDDIPQNIMGDIAVDWDRGTIWVGKGENNSSRSSYAGNGIWKSTDAGKTWTNYLPDIQRTGRIVIHPSNPDMVWVASSGNLYSTDDNRGVYRTTNGGQTWEKTLFVSDSAGIIDLVIDPSDPSVLYAAAWERQRSAWNFKGNGAESAIYKSSDSGKTWDRVTTGDNGFPADSGVGRIGLTIASKEGKTYLYAVHDNQNIKPKKEEKKTPASATTIEPIEFKTMSADEFAKLSDENLEDYLRNNRFAKKYTAASVRKLISSRKNKISDLYEYTHDANSALFDTDVIGAEVFLSTDGGETWEKTHSGYLDNVYFTYGYYFGQIRVNPADPMEIYIYGVPFLISKDGGKTWDYNYRSHVHVDHHALWVNPEKKGHLILGNDGGVYITYDSGDNWIPCNQPAVGQFYDIHYDKEEPYHVYGGLQDNGVWEGSSDSEDDRSWKYYGHSDYESIMGGDGMQVQVDYKNPDIVITGFQFGNYFRVDRSRDKTTYITPRHDLGENPYRWNWQSPILLSEHHDQVLYMGSNRFHRSLDRGDTWQTLSDDLTTGGKVGNVPYGTLTCIVESPSTFGHLYVGSDDGRIHKSKDGGYNWTDISKGLPQNLWVSRIALSAADEDVIYVSLNNYRNDDFTTYLFKSTDDGRSWQELPLKNAGAANVIAEDPEDKLLLYAGTDYGLFLSMDGGETFTDLSMAVDHAPVHDLFVHPVTKDLVIGTHGRSIYKASTTHLKELASAQGQDLYVFSIDNKIVKRERSYDPSKEDQVEVKFTVFSKKSGQTKFDLYGNDELIYSITENLNAGVNHIHWKLTNETEALTKRGLTYKIVASQGKNKSEQQSKKD